MVARFTYFSAILSYKRVHGLWESFSSHTDQHDNIHSKSVWQVVNISFAMACCCPQLSIRYSGVELKGATDTIRVQCIFVPDVWMCRQTGNKIEKRTSLGAAATKKYYSTSVLISCIIWFFFFLRACERDPPAPRVVVAAGSDDDWSFVYKSMLTQTHRWTVSDVVLTWPTLFALRCGFKTRPIFIWPHT